VTAGNQTSPSYPEDVRARIAREGIYIELSLLKGDSHETTISLPGAVRAVFFQSLRW
jgi:hypothetical protein